MTMGHVFVTVKIRVHLSALGSRDRCAKHILVAVQTLALTAVVCQTLVLDKSPSMNSSQGYVVIEYFLRKGFPLFIDELTDISSLVPALFFDRGRIVIKNHNSSKVNNRFSRV